jgi:hypothetical protein
MIIGEKRMNSRFPAREAGMTSIGFMIIAIFVGLIAFAAIQLTPVYLNYMKVAGVLNGVLTEFDGKSPTRGAIRTSISRRFDVESVSVLSAKNIIVTTENSGFVVAATYDHTSPFIGNISFTVHFDKQVLVRR